MSLKKKILLFVIGFFALHALTWWIWGTERLLVQGYEYLEGTEMCSPEIDGRVLSKEIFEDTTHIYIGERIWTTPKVKGDKLFNLDINGVSRLINSSESERWENLLEEYHSGNKSFRVNYIDREYANPYYQNVIISCWAYGSDWSEDHEPYLIWAFFGWIEITYEQTIAKLINKYRN